MAFPDAFTTYTTPGTTLQGQNIPDHPAVHLQQKTALENLEKITGVMPGAPFGYTSSESVAYMLHSKSRLNYLINGNMAVYLRGVGPFTSGYGIDQWRNNSTGTTQSVTREVLPPATLAEQSGNTTGFLRTVVAAGAGASDYAAVTQFIEGVGTLQGSSATVSFWAKANATKIIAIEFNQLFGAGGFPSTDITAIAVQQATLTASWAKYTFYVSIPSLAGKTIGSAGDSLAFNIWFDAGSTFNTRTATLGHQSGTFDITNIQIEKGWTPSIYEDVPIARQVLDCSRFFQSIQPNSYLGAVQDTTAAYFSVPLVASLRGTPTLSAGTLANAINEIGVAFRTPTAVTVLGTSGSSIIFYATGAASMTVGRPCTWSNTITLSAEL